MQSTIEGEGVTVEKIGAAECEGTSVSIHEKPAREERQRGWGPYSIHEIEITNQEQRPNRKREQGNVVGPHHNGCGETLVHRERWRCKDCMKPIRKGMEVTETNAWLSRWINRIRKGIPKTSVNNGYTKILTNDSKLIPSKCCTSSRGNPPPSWSPSRTPLPSWHRTAQPPRTSCDWQCRDQRPGAMPRSSRTHFHPCER